MPCIFRQASAAAKGQDRKAVAAGGVIHAGFARIEAEAAGIITVIALVRAKRRRPVAAVRALIVERRAKADAGGGKED